MSATPEISESTLTAIAKNLGKRDFEGFATEVAKIWPVLGELARLCAQAADAGSPDLEDWPGWTMRDAVQLKKAGIDPAGRDTKAATDWFYREYV